VKLNTEPAHKLHSNTALYIVVNVLDGFAINMLD
jgi:hypothetical protein